MKGNLRTTYDFGGARPVRMKDRDASIPSAFEMTLESGDGTPDLSLRFEVRDGVPQCRRATLQSSPDGREVLASDLRGVKLEDLLELWVARALWVYDELREDGCVVTVVVEPPEDGRREALAQLRAVRRDARRKVTDEFLREVARVYRENADGNPTAAVARFSGRSHRSAAMYVKQAREAGLLGPAIRGKAGEQPS